MNWCVLHVVTQYSPFDVDDARLHPEIVQLAANLIQRLDEEIEFGRQSQ